MGEVYRIAPRVSSEIVGGEAMILDLDNGNYYNLSQSGVMVWEMLKEGASLGEIVEGLSACFEGDARLIGGSAEKLLAEFKEDRLITAVPDDAGRRRPEMSVVPKRVPFVEPVFSRFTDLKDLLMIDPIHEVDHGGWPLKT